VLLGYLDLPVRDLGQLLGWGKTKAHQEKMVAVAALRLLADDDSTADAVVDLCVQYVDNTPTEDV
jgi:hypothetical protein